jgi:hypothetical protein
MVPLGRITYILEDNLEMEFREIWYEVKTRLNQLRIRTVRTFLEILIIFCCCSNKAE